MPQEITYTYFLSYSYDEGYGNMVYSINRCMDTADSIVKVTEYLQRHHGIEDVVLLNFIQLKVEEEYTHD